MTLKALMQTKTTKFKVSATFQRMNHQISDTCHIGSIFYNTAVFQWRQFVMIINLRFPTINIHVKVLVAFHNGVIVEISIPLPCI